MCLVLTIWMKIVMTWIFMSGQFHLLVRIGTASKELFQLCKFRAVLFDHTPVVLPCKDATISRFVGQSAIQRDDGASDIGTSA
jgi:hypothetical protein